MNEKNVRNEAPSGKREKGLAMMEMMNGMPDDLVLSGSPETAPVREKKENRFLRLMSSPVAAVILSVCVAFAVVVAIIRAGTDRPVTPGGNPGSMETEREDTEKRILTKDFENFRFVIEDIEDACAPDGQVHFVCYIVNIGEPFSYNGYSFYFRPAVQISGNGMQPLKQETVIDCDANPGTYTVKTGDKSSAQSFWVPVRLLNGEGAYTVTLSYNGVYAVFEDVFTVCAGYTEADTSPADTEADTSSADTDAPVKIPDGWSDLSLCHEAYAFNTENGGAVCFLCEYRYREGAAFNCFGSTKPQLLEHEKDWITVTSAQELEQCIGSYVYDARYIPAEEQAPLNEALASFTDSYFETRDVLLLLFNTPSMGDRYVIDSIQSETVPDIGRTLTLSGHDACDADVIKVEALGTFLAVIPIEKGLAPDAVYAYRSGSAE